MALRLNTHNGKMVVGLVAFKNFFTLWFYQGALLTDQHNVLINAQEGKTKAMRQLRFEHAQSIDYDIVKAYIDEAIQNQKDGKEIKVERSKPLAIPEILQARLDDYSDLKAKFDALSLSKQRDFCTYIDEAKRKETKLKRLEKIEPMILEGIGMNDKYMR